MAILTDLLASPYLVDGIIVALGVVFLSNYFGDFADGFPYKNIPSVGWDSWTLTNKKAKDRFVSSARELIAQGFDQVRPSPTFEPGTSKPGKTAFQLMFSFRPVIVLHPRYLEEVKSHPHLDFHKAIRKSFFGGRYPGFEVFQGDTDNIVTDLVNKKLTHALGQITIPLSREVGDTLRDTYSDSKEWSTHTFAQEVPNMVARVSSLVFQGTEICQNKKWLDVSVNYAIDSFIAARELRQWPGVLRPIVHWFLPAAQRTREHMKVGRQIIGREIARRGLVQGEIPKKVEGRQPDAIDWSHEIAAGRPFDATLLQVGLGLAAIHTTSNLLTNVMYDLTAHQEYIQPLRDEIKAVVEEEGILRKTGLTKLKLMDSVIKETQRMNPISMTSIHRYANKEIPLSDGTIIPKNASIVISSHNMGNEEIYPGANTYDGYRFFNKRQEPGNAHRFQLVTTSPEHTGFGHGLHACPGRFFAANEVKILLIHLLMKYEWKFADREGRPKNFDHGTEIICDPTVKFLFRRREPEIDLALLGEGDLA
ncbi:hypothetical protein FQN54_000387 [Arachnomyces sp. PD_36]|nr:hypothetical protein FQN54_000387 [Arachnomyces sp. PD_36]